MKQEIAVINSKTMSSIDLVVIINSVREEGQAEMRHDNFMAKIEKHPGIDALKFKGIYMDSINREKPCYYLPEREAKLMVMSESLKVQTAVYDRMAELEIHAPALPDFANPAAAARAWADALDATNAALAIANHATATKAEIGNRREATAMNTASQAVKKVAALEIELDQSKQYASVKRMQMIYHGQKFDWRKLKSAGQEMGILPTDIFDANYDTVKAYHADVWREVYALSIDGGSVA